jgi:hypothetical protein
MLCSGGLGSDSNRQYTCCCGGTSSREDIEQNGAAKLHRISHVIGDPAGILVCRNEACKAGENHAKYWCDTCIESKVCGKVDVDYSSFAECFDVVTGVPKQQDDWS